MKKYILVLILICISFCTLSVYALTGFNFDSSKLSFSTNSKKSSVLNMFDSKYNLSISVSGEDASFENEIKELTKRTTYYLLGDFNNTSESDEVYYKRKRSFYDLAAYKYFKKDKNTSSGFDESNPLYGYVVASQLAIPQLFNKFNELGIVYNSYGDIRVSKNNDLVISTLILPNVKILKEDEEDAFNYKETTTNLVIYYYYIKIDGEYRLTYLFGEDAENLNKYFEGIEDSESKSVKALSTSYESELTSIYNFDKVNALGDNELNNIYNLNSKNLVYLTSYYNNKVISNANGIFINDGIVLTTWTFMEKSLINSQYISLKDNFGNVYEIDGIVTANLDASLCVIKVKNKSGTYVKLSDKKLNVEDAAVTLSSKSGVGLTIQKGLVISNDEVIQTSIPLTDVDEGSGLFDKDGQLIGLNTSRSTNTGISISIGVKALKEVQDKFLNMDFDSINAISFDKLKNEYYYTKESQENVINNIPKNKWNKYKKQGNIEENIKLELVKANYKDGIVSLRYKNNISQYISSLYLAVSFREELIKEGYKEVLNSDTKCIYENSDYQIIIMDEFDYLIVVMVKK